MTEGAMDPEGQKFSLHLSSRTERKRILEAVRVLSGIYPFEVSAENILVRKTGRKGLYDVYLSGNRIRKSRGLARIPVLLFVLLALSAACMVAVRHELRASEAASEAKKESERREQERQKVQKEKEKMLGVLKKEYEEMSAREYGKIYPYIERVYSVMPKDSTVENLSIDRDSFSVEVTTRDAMKILSNFEGRDVFRSVRMNRTTIKDGRETVTYAGEFSKARKEADESLGVEEKTEFYSRELETMRLRAERLRGTQLSEYINGIRETLRKNGCAEQYIQLRGSENSTEIEFFVLSSSRDILNFISEIQDGDDSLVDIRQIRILNSKERNRVQTTIRFDSGIELRRGGGMPEGVSEKKIPASEIDNIFRRSAGIKTAAAAQNRPRPSVPARKNVPVLPQGAGRAAPTEATVPDKALAGKFSYVGLARTDGKTFVIARDNGMASLHKFLLGETSESMGDMTCAEIPGGFLARFRGEYYEVKK